MLLLSALLPMVQLFIYVTATFMSLYSLCSAVACYSGRSPSWSPHRPRGCLRALAISFTSPCNSQIRMLPLYSLVLLSVVMHDYANYAMTSTNLVHTISQSWRSATCDGWTKLICWRIVWRWYTMTHSIWKYIYTTDLTSWVPHK